MNLRTPPRCIPILLPLLLAACASPQGRPPSASHLSQAAAPLADPDIPKPVEDSLAVPKPKGSARTETYSVVVNNVRVQDLLFALARDAKVNVDIHSGLQGNVTLNAIDQTLPQILDRLARQVDLRWEIDGQNLSVMPDTPFLRTYRVDYVSMNRDTTGSVAVSTQITSSLPGASSGSGSNNNSTTKIDNTAKNRFWETLIQNVKDILHETDKILPEGSSDTVVEQASNQNAEGLLNPNPAAYANRKSANQPLPASQAATATTVVKRATFREAASVIAHPESGTIAVRATARQHYKMQEFLDQVMVSAKRQVLIEATIAEVELTNQYQQGIDWARVASSANSKGIFFAQTGAAVTGPGLLTLTARGDGGDNASFTSAIRLLETFGTVKVLSSPKISVLNNQPAVLKVVDNEVYFVVKQEPSTRNQDGTITQGERNSTPFTVPVGFVMNVTPQISESNAITINIRPSISRVTIPREDPVNPGNFIPVVRSREMESVIRLEDGSTAVLGGLMEDSLIKDDSAVPWFHRIPLFGAVFAQKSSTTRKTELVIFLRPTVIREPSLSTDFARLRQHLPEKDYFNNNKETPYQLLPSAPDRGGEPK